MARTLRFSIAAFVISIFVVCPAEAASQYGDILVRADSPASIEKSHGYTEYRVVLNNLSPQTTHHVKLILPERTYSGGSITRSVAIEPLATVNVTLFAPIPVSGTGLGVSVDGQLQRTPVPLNFSSYGYDPRPVVLISQGAFSKGFLTQAANGLKNPSDGKEQFNGARSDSPVSEWSTSWLSYSGYDGVVVTSDEIAGMPEPVGSALTRYVECGGSLAVIGAWEPPDPWRRSALMEPPLSFYYAAFGQYVVLSNGSLPLTIQQWERIRTSWSQTQAPWSSGRTTAYDPAAPNRVFPVIGSVTIPVRGLLLIMLIFVMVIGPVNLFVLSRKRKKIWMLWTVPLISLLTCVAVSAYSLVSEGWSGRARYLSMTVLDQASHRGTTIGISAFYTPLTPSDGLRYSVETEISPQARFVYGRSDQAARTVEWGADQHLESGWVTARTPSHLMIRRSETRRERIVVNREANGALSVLNGLGVQIRALWVADEEGKIHKGSNIAAGASASVSMTKANVAKGIPNGLRTAFTQEWTELARISDPPTNLLRPLSYIAVIETSPFIEEGLKGAREKKYEAVVYGVLKGLGDEN